MKKIAYLLVLSTLLLASCKKQEITPKSIEQENVGQDTTTSVLVGNWQGGNIYTLNTETDVYEFNYHFLTSLEVINGSELVYHYVGGQEITYNYHIDSIETVVPLLPQDHYYVVITNAQTNIVEARWVVRIYTQGALTYSQWYVKDIPTNNWSINNRMTLSK